MGAGYDRWKFRQLAREQQEAVAAVESDLSTVQGDVSTVQGDVGALQTDVGDLQTDVGDLQTDVPVAQATADEALVTAEGVAQAFGQDQVTGGVSPTPYIVPVNGGTQAEIRLGPGLTADAILYRVYTGPPSGSFGGYSGAFSIGPGDTVEAYSTTTGLTDSPVATYDN
jgi:hypothetical protein